MNSPLVQGIPYRTFASHMSGPASKKGQVVVNVRTASVPEKKKSRKTKKNNAGSSRKTSARSERRASQFSPCVLDYAMAIVNPFDGPIACVPSSYPPIPTQKVRVWSRGTLSLGDQGTGFILVRPNYLFSNSSASVATSGGPTFVDPGFPATTGSAGVTNSMTNAPYSSAQLGSGSLLAQVRLVSVGLRVWYIGTELNLQGEMIGLRHPDNDSLLGVTKTQALSFPSSRRCAVTSQRDTLDVTWIPTRPRDLEFQDLTVADSYCLGVMVSGTATTNNAFGYEVYGIGEYVGSNVTNRTPSAADPEGFAAVLTAAQSTGDTWYGSAVDATRNLLSNASSILAGMSRSTVGRAFLHAGASSLMRSAGLQMPNSGVLPITNVRPSTVTIEDVTDDFGIEDRTVVPTQPRPVPTQPTPRRETVDHSVDPSHPIPDRRAQGVPMVEGYVGGGEPGWYWLPRGDRDPKIPQ